jgi:hypothetical protein
MNQGNIALKLPPEWAENLRELATKNNQSVQELILEILAKYLEVDYHSFQGRQIREEIKKLSEKISQLERQDYQFKKVTDRLYMLEKLIVSLQTQVNNSKPSKDLDLRDDEEDIDDEPDEILTDFLDR